MLVSMVHAGMCHSRERIVFIEICPTRHQYQRRGLKCRKWTTLVLNMLTYGIYARVQGARCDVALEGANVVHRDLSHARVR